jgi:hypothetical protein
LHHRFPPSSAHLKALPPDIKHVYVNAVPLPSGVADMTPFPDNADTNKPGPGKCFPANEKAFEAYDFKTHAGAETVKIDGKVLSNIMIEGPDLIVNPHWRGGLMELDGMHPTIIGYAIMAEEILRSIKEFEGIVAPNPPDIAAACQTDTLLQHVFLSWDAVLDLSLDLCRASVASGGAAVPTAPKYDAVAGLLKALDFKYK